MGKVLAAFTDGYLPLSSAAEVGLVQARNAAFGTAGRLFIDVGASQTVGGFGSGNTGLRRSQLNQAVII